MCPHHQIIFRQKTIIQSLTNSPMPGKTLKHLRFAIQLVVFITLTAAYASPALVLPIAAPFLERIQIVPALLAFSLLTFVLWLAITLLLGRFYCSTVCPLGTLQDIFAKIPRLKSPVRRYRYTAPRSRLRYTFLIIMLAAMIAHIPLVYSVLDPDAEFSNLCQNAFTPLLTIFGLEKHTAMLPLFPSLILAFVVTLSLFVFAWKNGRTACNNVCPVGTALGLVSRYSVFQIDIDTDKCINCGLCADACKGQCIKLPDHTIDGSRCVTCFSCLPVCPNDAIHFTTKRKQLSIPLLQALANQFPPEKSTALTIQKPYKNETIS